MSYKSKNPFMAKLALSIIALSIVGLVAMYIIVNTIVRNTIYENVIGVAHGDVQSISIEIDAWFNTSNHIINNLTRIWPQLGTDYVKPVSDGLLEEYDFIADIYVGFEDGSILGSVVSVPGDDWDSTTRSWYIDAAAARGQIVTTSPYLSALENLGVITSVTKWVPDFGGMEAVMVVSIRIDYIVEMVNQFRLADGGYLILVDQYDKIVSHPNIEYILGSEGIMSLIDIPNGGILMEFVASEADIERFADHRFGDSYAMTFTIESNGWTLVAVVPATAITEPVAYRLTLIMFAFAAILVGLFILTMIFVSILTRNMEEGRVAEERLRILIDNMPLVANFRDKNFNILECNEAAVTMFDLSSKEEYLERFFELSPEYQPDGKLSREKAESVIKKAFDTGHLSFEWMHQKLNGEPVPTEVTLTRVNWRGEDSIVAFVRDLRDINQAVAMVEKLEKAAFTDVLTGARNRRYFMETAEKELQECIKGERPFSLILIDVDHFKHVNDTCGHPVGDEVLRILVARISHIIKKDTMIARYGGEEFVITLPEVDYKSVLSTADRIRSSIETSGFKIGDLELAVTISLGVASKSEKSATLQEIINNADKALYEAKQTGRNRVICCDG